METPTGVIDVFDATYECSFVQNVSLNGFLTEESCQYFRELALIPCGCDDGTVTASTSNATTSAGPTLRPTASPTVAPTTTTTENTTSVNATLAPSNVSDLTVEVCNPCPNGELVSPDGLIILPGQTDHISCSELESAGKNGIIPSAVCPAVQDLAAVPCCGVEGDQDDVTGEVDTQDLEGFCNPCGPDREITKFDGMVSIPTEGVFSCQELTLMGRAIEQDQDWCVLIRPFVQTPCGCRSTFPTMAPSSLVPAVTPTVDKTLDETETTTGSVASAATISGHAANAILSILTSGCFFVLFY
jgi:hypothetical protein